MQVRQKLRYRQWAVEEDAGVFIQRIHLCETSFGVPHSNLCGYHLNLAKILINKKDQVEDEEGLTKKDLKK